MNKANLSFLLVALGIALLCLSLSLSNSSERNVNISVGHKSNIWSYMELQNAARQHLPSWGSLASTASLADMKSMWREDQSRLTSEVRARMDAEEPVPKVRRLHKAKAP